MRTFILFFISMLIGFSAFASDVYSFEGKNYDNGNSYKISHEIFSDYQLIEFSGPIMPIEKKDGLEHVKQRLVKGLDVILVIKYSRGGYSPAFDGLGQALRDVCKSEDRGKCQITTYVEQFCASACVSLFMYGDNRLIADSKETDFGFHRTYVLSEKMTIDSPEVMAKKYISLGANAEWLMSHLNIFTDDQKNGTWLYAKDLLDANIATAVTEDWHQAIRPRP